MKIFMKSSLLLLVLFGSSSLYAMGRPAQVFETPTQAAIWDQGNAFYMRIDLENLADLKDQKFLWAGFAFEDGQFKGEIVADQFSQNERRFPARAKLLHSNETGRYFLVEVLGTDGKVIKEFFMKGPASDLPER